MSGGVAGVVAVACFAPTEVKLEISTDVPCSPNAEARMVADIRVGANAGDLAHVAQAEACVSTPDKERTNTLGSLVLVPSDAHDAKVLVEVALTTDGSSTERCRVPTNGGDIPDVCIVARRIFRFMDHKSRTLPIKLDSDCRGKLCDPNTTCYAGQCVSAVVEDNGDCLCSPDTPKPPAPPDATDGPADAAVDSPAMACLGPAGDGVVAAVSDAPTSKLIANTSSLFFRTSGGEARRVDKKLGTSESFILNGAPVTDLAADDDALWLLGPSGPERIPLGAPATRSTFSPLANGRAIAMVDPRSGGSPSVFVALDGVVFSLDKNAPAGSSLQTTSASGGVKLAVRAGDVYYTWVAPGLLRRRVDGAMPNDLDAADVVEIVAHPSGVVYSTYAADSGTVVFADDDATVPNQLEIYDAGDPQGVAVDGTAIYWLDSSPALSLRGIWKHDASGTRRLASVPTSTTMRGLVVDDQCVYYWASDPLGGGAIRSWPK